MRARITRRDARKNAFFFDGPAGDRSGIGRGSAWHRSGIGRASVRHRPGIGQASAGDRSGIGRASVRHRPGIGIGRPTSSEGGLTSSEGGHRWKSSPHRWKSSDPTDGKVHRSRAVASARLMPAFILPGINLLAARFILLSKSVRLR